MPVHLSMQTFKRMKRLLVRLLIFGAIFIFIDILIGEFFVGIDSKAIGGNTARHNMVVYKTKADILFMGGSRCLHHYDSKIIADSLKLTCWNAGQGGHGILMMYPFYKMLSKRYTPKLIVYDLWVWDVEKDDNTKYLEWIRRFYGVKEVDSIIWDIAPNERYKMLCRSYRYNGNALDMISDMFRETQPNIMGFIPNEGRIKNILKKRSRQGFKTLPIDPLKKKYLIKLILDCKHNNTKIVFMVSPYYGNSVINSYYAVIKRLCFKYNVPFIDHEGDKDFQDPKYFCNEAHLNRIGAEKYSKLIVPEIRDIFSNNK